MKKLTLALLVCLLFTPVFISSVFCEDIRNNWGQSDTHAMLRRELPYDLVYRGASRGGVSTIVSSVSKLTSANLAFSILKLSGADKTFTIAAGETGKEITLIKDELDDRTLKLDFGIEATTPVAHTGFSTITWSSDPGSYVTLNWVDDTIGWVITGSQGVTISY